jgi:prolyl oligopeptidase
MIDVSRNGRILAYFIRRGGEDETEVRFMDLETGKDLPVSIPRHLNRGFALKEDGSGAFYTLQDRTKGPRVRYIDLASGAGDEIFGEGYGTNTFIRPTLAGGDRYLLFQVQHGWSRGELFLKRLRSEKPVERLIRGEDALFNATPAGDDHLVVQTTWKAPNGRLLRIDLANPQAENWKEIVPASDDAIQGHSIIGGKLFVRYLHNVATRIRTYTLDGKLVGQVDLPGLGTAALWGTYDEPEGVLTYTSFDAPRSTYIYDSASGRRRLFAKSEVPFNPSDFQVRQVWYNSKDGTRVPMFLVHKKGLKPDGNVPTLLYGYGGFNVAMTPVFSPAAALWVEQGGLYALANIRGGGEFGERWHHAGMLGNKQNVFDDFIAAAQWLIANKFTNSKRLAIQGGSNGGLLVGAALTQRPDLFRAVLCQYPDLDMLGTYRFKNFNKPALLEYGDASKPEQFKFLYAYSPYQKVKEGTKYPAVLLTTGDADTRVPPLQARKMTARLQSATASGYPVLLLYDTLAGHAGGRPQSRIIEDMSLEFAFLFDQLGISWKEARETR